jgi:hypothetical protein
MKSIRGYTELRTVNKSSEAKNEMTFSRILQLDHYSLF